MGAIVVATSLGFEQDPLSVNVAEVSVSEALSVIMPDEPSIECPAATI